MTILRNLLNSEKAVAAGMLVVVATALLLLGRVSVAEWMEYTKVLLGIYVGGKTIHGAAVALASRPRESLGEGAPRVAVGTEPHPPSA